MSNVFLIIIDYLGQIFYLNTAANVNRETWKCNCHWFHWYVPDREKFQCKFVDSLLWIKHIWRDYQYYNQGAGLRKH